MQSQAGFMAVYNRLLENMFIKKEERQFAFVQQSDEQRYFTLI